MKKLFTQKIVKNMGFGSGKNLFRIPDPGSKRQRIPDPDPQHWITGKVPGSLSKSHIKNNGFRFSIEEPKKICIKCEKSRWNHPAGDLQCCGSMTFWGGSGSADPCLWLMDPDPGSRSSYFRHWPSRCQQKTNFLTQFFLFITFWSYIYIIFQR